MRWAGRTTARGQVRKAYKILVENLKGHLRDLDVNGRVILKWILKKMVGECRLDSCGSGWRSVAGSCEHGNDSSHSVKRGNSLTNLATIKVSRKTLLRGVSY
jgi:hypothetical protein